MEMKYGIVIDSGGNKVDFVRVLLEQSNRMEKPLFSPERDLHASEKIIYDDWQSANNMLKAHWTGTAWEETATPEEIAAWEKEHPAPPPLPPSPIELLAAENHLLKAQMQAQSGRNDFIEDCIAEMAMQIYNT